MPRWSLEHADIREWCAAYDGPPFHAVLCDPPYHLIQDTRNGSQRVPGTGPYGRHTASTKGFMGKEWDGGNIAFRPETWAALGEHLHPGAFLMAFGGSRTYHRLACAIEDAGFIIHPAISWVYGSGFPKATRIDTQVDKRGGVIASRAEFVQHLRNKKEEKGYKRDEINELLGNRKSNLWSHFTNDSQPSLPTKEQFEVLMKVLDIDEYWRGWFIEESERDVIGRGAAGLGQGQLHQSVTGNGGFGFNKEYDMTAPATDLARAWAGHRYGLQALKPAAEFICVAQKPYEGKPIECITATGAGALWIDGARIAGMAGDGRWGRGVERPDRGPFSSGQEVYQADSQHPAGRWPANFALCHTPECRRVGERRVRPTGGRGPCERDCEMMLGQMRNSDTTTGSVDPDGLETVAAWECAPGCPAAALDAQAGEGGGGKYRPPTARVRNNGIGLGTSDRRSGSSSAPDNYGDTGGASRFFFVADWSCEIAEQIEAALPFQYEAKAARAEREAGLRGVVPCLKCGQVDTEYHINDKGEREPCRRNGHPTVKVIALCRWLATLLLPPAQYAPRRILVPFAGVGSEMIGAGLAGWDEMVGVELLDTEEEPNVTIGKSRLAHWLAAERCAAQLSLEMGQ